MAAPSSATRPWLPRLIQIRLPQQPPITNDAAALITLGSHVALSRPGKPPAIAIGPDAAEIEAVSRFGGQALLEKALHCIEH
jgi:hypothetical protein